MLRLRTLTLVQFKNYLNRSLEFNERIIGICGKNGAGKTNLLDAIYYLCFTRSYFNRVDSSNILFSHNGFRLEGEFLKNDKAETVVCILRETGKKEFSLNGQAYDKFSRHLGHYPCVIIAPDDIQIITGHSEERRKFLDTILAQIDPQYLAALIQYNRILVQRNSLLRNFADGSSPRDPALLNVLDKQLSQPGQLIFEKRKEFLIEFLPLVKKLYHDISLQFENINLYFESQLLHGDMQNLLHANLQKDQATCRTTAGVHRDDLEFTLAEQPFKNVASQGQRKSLLFALKLAEMEVLRKAKGFSPLLLLDDVFEKLDEDRIVNLLKSVCHENDGQVFITDTNAERLESHLTNLELPYQLVRL